MSRSGDRPLLPDDARAGQRDLDRALVLHARDQPDRRRRARREAGRPGAGALPPWLRDMRALRPHQLADEIEKLLHEKSVAGRAAWVRLFDETMAELRFPFGGRELTEAEAMHLLSDRDGAVRREAAQVARRGAGRQRPRLRADHQHAGQGQGDRGPLAQVSAPDLIAQPCRISSRTMLSMR